jgi:hypothetical protein
MARHQPGSYSHTFERIAQARWHGSRLGSRERLYHLLFGILENDMILFGQIPAEAIDEIRSDFFSVFPRSREFSSRSRER